VRLAPDLASSWRGGGVRAQIPPDFGSDLLGVLVSCLGGRWPHASARASRWLAGRFLGVVGTPRRGVGHCPARCSPARWYGLFHLTGRRGAGRWVVALGVLATGGRWCALWWLQGLSTFALGHHPQRGVVEAGRCCGFAVATMVATCSLHGGMSGPSVEPSLSCHQF
jgi:hypothetical protein